LLNRIVEEAPIYGEDFSDLQPDHSEEPLARMDIY
jgi:hypothetical protein